MSTDHISNNPSFCLKLLGVLDDSDVPGRTWYALPEDSTLPVAPATGRSAYLTSSLCAWYVVTYMHHQNDMCVTLVAGAPVML